ncbi:kinesin-like protein KIN-14Q isoform X3 [Chenopodium quinoa]|uniref:kinesin-like protein KIN-14Q isoform X3 n=1 Tax=Chenopodium quinoa TaxID=63459 RepID=UPI000B793B06|nr:kinesin-like protein KIN-14Q isoform X3 [Chenopodium quinoa]
MEDHNQWHDPLLLTDVSRQQQTLIFSHDSQSKEMENSEGVKFDVLGSTGLHQSLEIISPQRFTDLIKGDTNNGRSMLGFSLTAPDLVVCAGSPDILKQSSAEERAANIVLSLEEGINGVEAEASRGSHESPKFSSFWHSAEDIYGSESTGGIKKLQGEYDNQKKQLLEARKAIEELKKENEVKSNECQKALKSLHDLQNELMRKSMHVGSLAFAVEGQVKEKSKWLSSLSVLKRHLKILKLDQIKLSEEAKKYKDCLGDMDDLKSVMQATLTQQVSYHDELKRKISEGEKQRKELYNKVLELKGNIRVFCRCRPMNPEEISMGDKAAIDFESARDGELTIKSNGHPRKTFKFDAVFGPQAGQADVFEDTAPFATSVLDGYNVCIFAYGQTGTGKTFTMEGTEDARGVNYRTLAELFEIMSERQKLFQYEICVSVLEVYNEQIRDLLASGTQPSVASKRLEIRQASEGVLHVPGLIEAHVSNIREAWDVLQTGSNARAVGSTNANEHSSRSHCIHCVMVKGHNLLTGECTRSKLWLVDLAGSERIAKTEAQGERLKEAQNINKSLSALGDVISALANKSQHVPFRNSKLTHLLQDSLGGDSKALMFLQISPNENDLSETICSLNFASRVKGVELGPAKKQLDNIEFLRYKQLAEKTKQEAKLKDLQIKKMEETIHNMESKIKDKDQKNKNLQEKLKELEAQLLVERKLARQHVDTKIAEQQQQQMRQQFEDQNSAPNRPPLVAKTLGTLKNANDLTSDSPSLPRLFSDHNNHKTPSSFLLADSFLPEKENNPEIGELLMQPKKTGRASLCPTAQRIPVASNPRRNSLIPLPSTPMTLDHPSTLPFPPPLENEKEERNEVDKCLLEPAICSPVACKSGVKKLNSVLRRSLQKKGKSPMQQQLKKGGVNVGLEKVRVSIGSRGRLGQRVLLGNGRRMATREAKKQSQREKERGWNF